MSRIIVIAAFLSVAGFATPIRAADQPVHEFDLENGLKILVKQDTRAPVVISQVWYQVGSSDEHNGITGLSHMLEHMMFTGTGELEWAKKNITGSFPLNLDSNSDLLGYIATIGFYGLPLNDLNTFTDRVRSVTADQIRHAFQRRVHPDTFFKVIVGGAAQA